MLPTHPMCDLKVLLAGKLAVPLLHVAHDLATTLLRDAVASQHPAHMLPVPVAERTAWAERKRGHTSSSSPSLSPTMVVSLARWVGEDDLHAAVGCVVGPLALLPIAVADIVCILLLKLR